MSSVFETAVKEVVREEFLHFLYNDNDTSTTGQISERTTKAIKRRDEKMSWLNFSDKELRIVNEVEKNPGMGGKEIVALMEKFDAEYPDGQCKENMTKFLLSNLVSRKVLISQVNEGYILNDSDYPPAKPYIRK